MGAGMTRDEYIDKIVRDILPLTSDQLDRLAVILRAPIPAAGERNSAAA